MNHFVSFIVATLNEEDDLGDLLESIKKQTYKRHEIIVVDGGSKDKTVDIAKRYTKRVFSLPGTGVTKSKAYAIKRVKGDIVQFVDADNVVEDKNYLKKIVSLFDRHGVDAIAAKIMPTKPQGLIVRAQAAYRHLTWERKQKQVVFNVDPTKITFSSFKTSFLKKLLGDYENLIGNDDLYLARKASELGGKTVFDPAVVMHHKDPYSASQIKRQALWYGRVINQEKVLLQLSRLAYLGLFLLLYPVNVALALLGFYKLLIVWNLIFLLPALYLSTKSRDLAGSIFLIYALNPYRAAYFYKGFLKGIGKVQRRKVI